MLIRAAQWMFEFNKQWIDICKPPVIDADSFVSKLYSMAIKIISGILILVSAFMGTRVGWQGLNIQPGDTGPFVQIKQKLNFSKSALKVLAVLTILGAVLLLLPQTFLLANILNICLFLFLIVRWLMIGDMKSALSEVPFLLIPVLLLFLKHPFAVQAK